MDPPWTLHGPTDGHPVPPQVPDDPEELKRLLGEARNQLSAKDRQLKEATAELEKARKRIAQLEGQLNEAKKSGFSPPPSAPKDYTIMDAPPTHKPDILVVDEVAALPAKEAPAPPAAPATQERNQVKDKSKPKGAIVRAQHLKEVKEQTKSTGKPSKK